MPKKQESNSNSYRKIEIIIHTNENPHIVVWRRAYSGTLTKLIDHKYSPRHTAEKRALKREALSK